MTQVAVAGALGCTTDTVGNYERGRTEPRLDDVVRMARLYRVSLDWLLTGSARLAHRFEGNGSPRRTRVFEAPPKPAGDGFLRCPHLVPYNERCGECEA